MESAYVLAIQAYTKAKQDDLAAEVARELAEFRRHMPRPDDAKEFTGKFYKVFDQKTSWHEAQAACVEIGGHLAIVHDADENRFILNLAGKAGVGAVWLGATDEKQEGEWLWVNGQKMTFKNWHPTQPNNKMNSEHYLILMVSWPKDPSLVGTWHDQPDNSVQHTPGFVCQWD